MRKSLGIIGLVMVIFNQNPREITRRILSTKIQTKKQSLKSEFSISIRLMFSIQSCLSLPEFKVLTFAAFE